MINDHALNLLWNFLLLNLMNPEDGSSKLFLKLSTTIYPQHGIVSNNTWFFTCIAARTLNLPVCPLYGIKCTWNSIDIFRQSTRMQTVGMCKFKTTFRVNPCGMLSSHPVILFRRVFKQVTARYTVQYDSRINICTRYRSTHKHVQCQKVTEI
jgi:hypothetical protein